VEEIISSPEKQSPPHRKKRPALVAPATDRTSLIFSFVNIKL